MTESHVRSGYCVVSQIRNETPSAFDVIQESLHASLGSLSGIGREIIAGQDSKVISGKSSFQIPERIYMKDTNKDAWIEDLANSSKPLAEIAMQKVPLIGTKDAKVLELCIDKQIPYQRAIWFIKCVGYSEMKATPTIEQNTAFSKDWTKTILNYFSQQLAQLNSAQSSGNKKTNSQSIPKDHLQTKLKRLNYLLPLFRLQYDEDMLANYDFLFQSLILFQKMTTLAQISVCVALNSIFLHEYQKSRVLLKKLILISLQCLSKLKAMVGTSALADSQYSKLRFFVQVRLSELMDWQRLVLESPHAFVSNAIWRNIIPLRDDLFSFEQTFEGVPQIAHQTKSALVGIEGSLSQRTARLFPLLKPKEPAATLPQVLRALLAGDLAISFKFSRLDLELKTLLEWALKGEHFHSRVYLACRFLSANCGPKEMCVYLARWLDDRRETMEVRELGRISFLVRTLGDFGLFAVDRYLQMTAAGGELSSETTIPLLLSFGIRNSKKSFENERVLWFSQFVEHEASALRDAKQTICAGLSTMFSKDAVVLDHLQEAAGDAFFGENIPDVAERLSLLELNAFLKLKIAEWLRQSVFDYVVHTQTIGINNWKTMAVPGSSVLSLGQFAFIVAILESFEDFHTLLEISLWLMEKSLDRAVINSVVGVLQRHRIIYAALGCADTIFNSLWTKVDAGSNRQHTSPKPNHISQPLIHLLEYYDSFSSHAADVTSLKSFMPRSSTKRFSGDFSYLKDVGCSRSVLSKVIGRVLADLVQSSESGPKFVQSILHVLSSREYPTREEWLADLSAISYLLLRTLECGSTVGDSLLEFLQTAAAKLDTEQIWRKPWLYDLLLDILANQVVSFVAFMKNVATPMAVKLAKHPGNANLSLVVLHFVALLEKLFFGKALECFDSNSYHRVQAVHTLRVAQIATKSGISSVAEFASHCLLILSAATAGSVLGTTLESFLDELCGQPHWLKESFCQELPTLILGFVSNDIARAEISYRLLSPVGFRAHAAFQNLETLQHTLTETLQNPNVEHYNLMAMILFQVARLQKLAGAPGWEDSFSSLLQCIFLQHTPKADIDYAILVSHFGEELRPSFLGYLETLAPELLRLASLLDKEHPGPASPLFDKQTRANFLRAFRTIFSALFGSASAYHKDDSKKALKTTLLGFLKPFVGCLCLLVQTPKTFEDIAGAKRLDIDTTHVQGIVDVLLGIGQTCSRYIAELYGEIESAPVLQSLLQFLSWDSLPSVYGRHEEVFDIIAVVYDELPPPKAREFSQWVGDNLAKFSKSPSFDLIKTLTPVNESSNILRGIQFVSSESGKVVDANQMYPKPWELIEHGIGSQPPPTDASAWNTPAAVNSLNDTCISLACFGAKKVRPRPSAFESLYEYGWRPGHSAVESKPHGEDASSVFLLPESAVGEALDEMELELELGEMVQGANHTSKKRPAEDSLSKKRSRRKS
ncbi:RNA polymerase II mediator complex subunit [Kappamyces sp. JEL0680]|nr:RNA polymerase II mediator complex subunit [Kappamyces sp. JEL0680]